MPILGEQSQEVFSVLEWLLKGGGYAFVVYVIILWERGRLRHEREVDAANDRARRAEDECKFYRDALLRSMHIASTMNETTKAMAEVVTTRETHQ